MRALATMLCQNNNNIIYKDVPGVAELASFLDHRMCVPRDMGSMSAASIQRLAHQLSSS